MKTFSRVLVKRFLTLRAFFRRIGSKLLCRIGDRTDGAARAFFAEGKRFRNRADFIREMRAYFGKSRTKDSGKLTDITSSRRLGLIFDFQQERLSAEIFLAQGDGKGFRALRVDTLKVRNGFSVERVVQGSPGM